MAGVEFNDFSSPDEVRRPEFQGAATYAKKP